MQFNLADIFESVVDAIPDREAVICGDRRLTFRQVEERANRLAHHLTEAGVGPGRHVGMYLLNGTEYVEGMLACLKIRAVPINVNYRYVERELRYLFQDADLVALLLGAEFCPRVAAVRDEVPLLKHFLAVGSSGACADLGAVPYEEALAASRPDRDFPKRSPDDHFVIYTGGTTGLPKGVVWRQEDIFFTGMGGGNPVGQPAARPEEVAGNAKGREPVTQFPVPPLIHGAAQLAVFIGFFWGDRVVLIPKFDPELVWESVEREKVNTITIVGDAMARPMAETLAAHPDRWDLTSLVYLGSAGAMLSEAVKEQLRSLLPNTIVTENFGATETGYQGAAMPAEAGFRTGRRFAMNDRTTVLDDELRPIAPGSEQVGRLALRGRIPLGYYNDPQKTAQTFVEAEGQRWVLPGDMARVEPDGSITVLGRGAVCINSGGEKIFPDEVEEAVKIHPDVYDVVVVGVPDERWGERVVAVVELRPGAEVTLDDVVAHCRELIAGYKVPRELHVVEKVMRQPTGKPDYPWAKQLAVTAGATT